MSGLDNVIKLFNKSEKISEMMNEVSAEKGHDLPDIINDDDRNSYVEERLDDGTTTLYFSYPITGVNFTKIVEGAYVRYPVGYRSVKHPEIKHDIFRIEEIVHVPEEDVVEIVAGHWTYDFMHDAVNVYHSSGQTFLIKLLNEALRTRDDNNRPSYEILLKDRARVVGQELAESIFSSEMTVGQFLIGSGSPASKFLGISVRRRQHGFDLIDYKQDDRLEQDKSYWEEDMPIIEGVNLADWQYETSLQTKYNVVAPATSEIPSLYVIGSGKFGSMDGIGGTIYNSFNEIPSNYKIYFLYKGFPFFYYQGQAHTTLLFNSSPNKQTILEIYEDWDKGIKPRVIITPDVIGTGPQIRVIDPWGENTIIDEKLDFDYLFSYAALDDNTNNNLSREVMGVEVYNQLIPLEDEEAEVPYFEIPKTKQFLQAGQIVNESDLNRAVLYTDHMSPHVERVGHYTMYPFFFWRSRLKNYVPWIDLNPDAEPDFSLTLTIDDFKNIYGETDPEALNIDMGKYDLGKVFNVRIPSFNLRKYSSVTRVMYDGLSDTYTEIEFGSLKERELDEVRQTYNKDQSFTITNPPQSASGNEFHNPGGGGGIGGGGTGGGWPGGMTPEEIEEWIKDYEANKEKESNDLDEELEDNEPIEELPTEDREPEPVEPEFREDDGPMRVEWSESILRYDYRIGRTVNQTHPIFYNFAGFEELAKIKNERSHSLQASVTSRDEWSINGPWVGSETLSKLPRPSAENLRYHGLIPSNSGVMNQNIPVEYTNPDHPMSQYLGQLKAVNRFPDDADNYFTYYDMITGVFHYNLHTNVRFADMYPGQFVERLDSVDRIAPHEARGLPGGWLEGSIINSEVGQFMRSMVGMTGVEIRARINQLDDSPLGKVKRKVAEDIIKGIVRKTLSWMDEPFIEETKEVYYSSARFQVYVTSRIEPLYYDEDRDQYRYSHGASHSPNAEILRIDIEDRTLTNGFTSIPLRAQSFEWDKEAMGDSPEALVIRDLPIEPVYITLVDRDLAHLGGYIPIGGNDEQYYQEDYVDIINHYWDRGRVLNEEEYKAYSLGPAAPLAGRNPYSWSSVVTDKLTDLSLGKKGTNINNRYLYNKARLNAMESAWENSNGARGIPPSTLQTAWSSNESWYQQAREALYS